MAVRAGALAAVVVVAAALLVLLRESAPEESRPLVPTTSEGSQRPPTGQFSAPETLPLEETAQREQIDQVGVAGERFRISGKVVDAEHRQGIAGASVSLYTRNRRELEPLDATGTDSRGEFGIQIDSNAIPNIAMSVRATDYLPRFSSLQDDVKTEAHLEIALERGLSISGVVVDPYGNPLSGVRLAARDLLGREISREATTVHSGLLRTTRYVVGGPPMVTVSNTETDDAGSFSITGLADKNYSLIADPSDGLLAWPPVAAKAGAAGVVVVAIKSSRASVHVYDLTTGNPLKRFLGTFRIREVSPTGREKWITLASGGGHDGRMDYVWNEEHEWHPQEALIEIDAPGFRRGEGRGTFDADTLVAEVWCEPLRRVAVKAIATWDDGTPIPESEKLLVSYRAVDALGRSTEYKEAEDAGAHRFLLPEGRCELLVSPKPATSYSRTAIVWNSAVDGDAVRVMLKRGGDLEVLVPDSKGGSSWVIGLRGPSERFYVAPQAAGVLVIRHLEPGRWTVRAQRASDPDGENAIESVGLVTIGGLTKVSF